MNEGIERVSAVFNECGGLGWGRARRSEAARRVGRQQEILRRGDGKKSDEASEPTDLFTVGCGTGATELLLQHMPDASHQ